MDAVVRLHTVVQALEIIMLVGGRVVRAVVARSVFEELYGTHEPADWFAVYEAHKAEMHAAIERKAAQKPQAGVIVLFEADFLHPPHGRTRH